MKNKYTNPLLHALLPVAAVIIYVLLGYIFKGKGWAAGWLVFLLIPIVESAFTAFKTKNPSSFAYPVLVTAIFLAVGLVFHVWHPTWVLFVTIPAFYAICDYVNKNRQQKAFENPEQNPNMPTTPPFTQTGETPPPVAIQVPPYQPNYYNPPKKSSAAPIAISIIFSITAIVIAAIIGFFSFLRGGFSELIGIESFFENDSSYTEVNTSAEFDTANILELDIDWIDGSVNIQYYDGEKIYIEENGSHSRPMCYKIDGTTLKIDEYRNKNKLGINNASKDLTVKLPLTYKADEIDISVVAANVYANELNIGKLDFETVSGNGDFEFAVSPREIDTEAVSGGVTITLPSDVSGYSAAFETVSGSFIAKDFDNSKHYGNGSVIIDGDSVSGNLTVRKANSKTVAA